MTFSGLIADCRGKYGINHFDRNNRCRQGGDYKKVTWKLDLPDGKYQASCAEKENKHLMDMVSRAVLRSLNSQVEVIFPESTTKDCMVQGQKVCGARGPCKFSETVEISGGLKVTGYGHNSNRCHSLSKVKVPLASILAIFAVLRLKRTYICTFRLCRIPFGHPPR